MTVMLIIIIIGLIGGAAFYSFIRPVSRSRYDEIIEKAWAKVRKRDQSQ